MFYFYIMCVLLGLLYVIAGLIMLLWPSRIKGWVMDKIMVRAKPVWFNGIAVFGIVWSLLTLYAYSREQGLVEFMITLMMILGGIKSILILAAYDKVRSFAGKLFSDNKMFIQYLSVAYLFLGGYFLISALAMH